MAQEMDFNSTTQLGLVKVLMLKGEKGDTGESGTSGNYNQLTNRPQINGVTLTGNQTGTDLGLTSQASIDALSNDIANRTWTDIPINSGQSAISTNSKCKYAIGYDGTVTLQVNLDFVGKPTKNGVVVATLPDEIKLHGSASPSGLAVTRSLGFALTNQSKIQGAFYISSSNQLYYYWFDDITANSEYVVAEFMFNPVW